MCGNNSNKMPPKEKPGRLTFYPFAYALLTDELCSYCWYCLNPSKAKKRCLGCGLALFCNKECQQLGWKDHKAECHGFKNSNTLPDIETRMLGRIVLRQKDILAGKDKKDANFYKNRQSERTIMEIWAHTEKMKKDKYAMNKFEDVYSKLRQFYDSKYLLPKDDVFELHCRDYINRHAISDKSYMKEIGKGLYLDLCAYDHSCKPNTIYSCVGFVATLRALDSSVNIRDKATTFYAYIELLSSQQERKKQLKDTWYFDCQCARCVDSGDHALTSVLCPNCPEGTETRVAIFGNPSYKDPISGEVTCPGCSTVLPKEYLMETINNMRFVDQVINGRELDQMPMKGRVEFLQDLLQRYQKTMPNVNVYLCRIIQHLIPLIAASDHKELLRLHLLSEECVRHCFPPNHPAVAFHLRNTGIFYQGLKDRANAVKYIREAQQILEFTLDGEHPMTVENKNILEDAMSSDMRPPTKKYELPTSVRAVEEAERKIESTTNESSPTKHTPSNQQNGKGKNKNKKEQENKDPFQEKAHPKEENEKTPVLNTHQPNDSSTTVEIEQARQLMNDMLSNNEDDMPELI